MPTLTPMPRRVRAEVMPRNVNGLDADGILSAPYLLTTIVAPRTGGPVLQSAFGYWQVIRMVDTHGRDWR